MLLCKKLIEVVFCLLFLFLSNFVIYRENDITFSLSTQLRMYWLFLFLTNPWPFATFPQNFFRNNFCYHHRIFLRGWSWRKFLFFVSVHTFSLALLPHQREAIKSCSQQLSWESRAWGVGGEERLEDMGYTYLVCLVQHSLGILINCSRP